MVLSEEKSPSDRMTIDSWLLSIRGCILLPVQRSILIFTRQSSLPLVINFIANNVPKPGTYDLLIRHEAGPTSRGKMCTCTFLKLVYINIIFGLLNENKKRGFLRIKKDQIDPP